MPAPDFITLQRLLSPDARRTPEMGGLFEWIVAEDAKDPDTARVLNAQEGRALMARQSRRWNRDLPEVASVEVFTIAGLGHAPPVRVDLITPQNAKPGCILYAHGGGWAFGDLDTHQRTKRVLARAVGTRVLGIDYRMAPEHRFPAPLEDMQACWRWLVAQGDTNAALKGPLAVAGDSAGANLALSLILREMELKRAAPMAGLLFYGIYCADFDSPSYERFASGYGLTRALMMQFFDWYAPGLGPEDARHRPLVTPINASQSQLATLPPLFLNAAGLDVLLCDTLALAKKLDAAGTHYELALHEGVHHGFLQYTAYLEESNRAIRLAADFFKRSFGRRD